MSEEALVILALVLFAWLIGVSEANRRLVADLRWRGVWVWIWPVPLALLCIGWLGGLIHWLILALLRLFRSGRHG